jgi:hypothetical protein
LASSLVGKAKGNSTPQKEQPITNISPFWVIFVLTILASPPQNGHGFNSFGIVVTPFYANTAPQKIFAKIMQIGKTRQPMSRRAIMTQRISGKKFSHHS